ncbi:MAG: HAMP domain-containing protein [Proteobacteria bacterium]|nr:HAMP domain-containing protein [Pseudomonadota bacterium]
MLRLSNISIGMKLSIMSGLGMLLVCLMIGVGMYTDNSVKASQDYADGQERIVADLKKIESSFVLARLAMRNIRLAETDAELQAANNLAALQKNIAAATEKLLPELRVPANRERLENAQRLINAYFDGTLKSIVPMQAEVIKLGVTNPERVAQVHHEMAAIQKEKLDPGVATSVKLLEEIIHIAEGRVVQEHEVAAQTKAFAEKMNLSIGIAVIVILLGSAVFGAKTIAKPLRALVEPLAAVSAGNFTVAVPGTGRKDEVGQIADAVHNMAEKMSQTIAEIKASGREVTNASAEIATSTTDLSQRTEEQAASLEETSAAMEELAATVRKNAENAQLANQDAATTREVADRGGQVVAKAVDAMARIEESSRKISDIIGVIDEIARQTNLLALNAAVEAARAGEAGRGFAVVASEVRSLAQRSSQAAKDIKDLITNSNGQVKDGVDLVNRAGKSLNEIVESINKVAVVVSEIANASAEQATGIDQINKALTQMDEVTQQNSALVEENAATAKTLEHQAKAMDEQVSVFQIADGPQGQGMAALETKAAVAARPAAKPAIAKPVAIKPAAKAAAKAPADAREMQATLATAVGQDWKEF